MSGYDQLISAAEPVQGWATTPADLLTRSGPYGQSIKTEEEWGSVLAGLTRPGLDGTVPPERADAIRAVLACRLDDLHTQGHPNTRQGIFASSPFDVMEPDEQAEARRVAEQARDEWRKETGGLSAARITDAHKFALACIERDARRAGA